MVGRKTRLVLGGIVGLLLAFASNSSVGAIILIDPFSPLRGGQGDPLQAFDGDLADLIEGGMGSDGVTPAAPRPSAPSDKQTDPLTLYRGDGLGPSGGAAGPPSSLSQGSGTGTMSAAAGVLFDLPEPPLQTHLPGEARTIMPTGPPFELLRPPRGSA